MSNTKHHSSFFRALIALYLQQSIGLARNLHRSAQRRGGNMAVRGMSQIPAVIVDAIGVVLSLEEGNATKALGLKVPPTLLARADEVIE